MSRIVWLTDTFGDYNGVSMVLRSVLEEIRLRNLPVDLLVCDDTLESEPNLKVIRPLTKFSFPFYRQQPIRVPGLFDLKRAFKEGNYDRIICSTEGPMGMAAIYLRKSFGVKSYFYLHTDWLSFARSSLKFRDASVNRVAKLLKTYYKFYDGIFVLNSDQRNWLIGESMKQDASRVFLTAHWVDSIFKPVVTSKSEVFQLENDEPVILYAGRISEEKGVFELPQLFRSVQKHIPNAKMVIAGTGPSLQKLQMVFPEATYLGWIQHELLPKLYSAADILVLPSRFDTFSCVVLEAQSCGLPVAAYNLKGPKDIIQHETSGFLSSDVEQMANQVAGYVMDRNLHQQFRNAAVQRGKEYNVSKILDQFLQDLNPIKVSEGHGKN